MEKKDAYVKKLQANLAEWTAEIDKLKAQADKAQADFQLRALKEIEDLRKRQNEARAKMEEIQKASEGAWEDLRTGCEKAWSEFEDAFKKAASRYKSE